METARKIEERAIHNPDRENTETALTLKSVQEDRTTSITIQKAEHVYCQHGGVNKIMMEKQDEERQPTDHAVKALEEKGERPYLRGRMYFEKARCSNRLHEYSEAYVFCYKALTVEPGFDSFRYPQYVMYCAFFLAQKELKTDNPDQEVLNKALADCDQDIKGKYEELKESQGISFDPETCDRTELDKELVKS
ncbi:Hypp5176 [Branchiostoma lanceolatum]|uniref:Hypp5176 protein n=1 Tax=Branchiostoma lanceolatum TaxID=7740 RepID=A0A8K0AGW5_BRALA|nr:Hypp5176 [Branchiostoma lanceolatum]